MKILVIEDESSMAHVVQMCIAKIRAKFPDANILHAATRSEGIRIVREIPKPDCVFLDLGLPDSTWDETLKRVDEFESESPVVILTGYPEKMISDLLENKEIQVIHKDDSMIEKILGAILRAISRGKSDVLSENIRRMRELLSEYASQK